MMFLNQLNLLAVLLIARASRVAPDSASQDYIDRNAVAGLVGSVCEGWCCHLADKSTLLLFVPSNSFSSVLSRENFVDLLEFCEDKLKCKRVLACFNKADIDPRQGIPRALKCIGFTVLASDQYPAAGIDKNTIFAMIYNI